MKLDFEIAVDQQTKTGDPTFGGSRTLTTHRCPRGSHTHVWSQFGPILTNHLNMAKTQILCALLVAGGLLNSYINFHPDWTENDMTEL